VGRRRRSQALRLVVLFRGACEPRDSLRQPETAAQAPKSAAAHGAAACRRHNAGAAVSVRSYGIMTRVTIDWLYVPATVLRANTTDVVWAGQQAEHSQHVRTVRELRPENRAAAQRPRRAPENLRAAEPLSSPLNAFNTTS
jgi:hypothetical protein